MHKKLEAELMSIAHQVLQLKNKEDVSALKEKAKEVYEKLSVLSFMDNYFESTPNASENKVELLAKIKQKEIVEPVKITTKEVKEVEQSPIIDTVKVEEYVEEIPTVKIEDTKIEQEKIEIQTNTTLMEEASKIAKKINVAEEKPSIKSLANTEEFKDTLPADVTANLFEKAKPKETVTSKVEPVKEKPKTSPISNGKTSLNDRLLNQKIQVGLNDRIAFVKHLFNFSQEDFNRVLSQLNTFTNEQESRNFIANQVKPDYDWSTKEEYEERLYSLIERRFL